MPHPICHTCGTQFEEADQPPDRCPICDEERQYVDPRGQTWTTMDKLRRARRNVLTTEEPRLTGIRTDPAFAIGQRALVVQTPDGNVLWDCVTLIDDATERAVRELGGIAAIAISHPHFYASMAEWSRVFGGVPIYVHAADRSWVMRAGASMVFWDGERCPLLGGTTLIQCGGHFPGSAALHWPDGAEGRGALLTGDTLQVVPDRRHVSFMYSYPNLIPLDGAAVREIALAVEGFRFDRVYGGFAGRVISSDGYGAVARSVERYLRALHG